MIKSVPLIVKPSNSKNGLPQSHLFAMSVCTQGCWQVLQYGLIYVWTLGQTNGNTCSGMQVEQYG
ncbi:MAG: hypothetical protein M0R21_10160 [Lentimicrobiaceae bacterium]|nr:hypothetical protein [Lentimicrobiaceae bacterium]